MSRPPFSRPLQRLLAVLATLVTIAATATAVLTSASAQTIDHNPIGALDLVQVTSTGIEASGWAADNDSPKTALPAAIERERTRVTSGYVANRPRPDVARAHPSFGAVHGFLISVPMRAGAYTICAEAGNIGPGVVDLVGCRKVVVSFDPTGVPRARPQRPRPVQRRRLGRRRQRGRPDRRGHLHRRDAPSPTRRPTWPGREATGSPSATPSPKGRTGCARPATTSERAPTGCSPARSSASTRARYGAIMGMHQIPGGFVVYGWASDLDTSGPISVQISADGTLLSTVTASVSVPGHPGHGFSAQILNRINAPGLKRLCIAGLNVGLGSNRMMQCMPLALNFNPTGRLDSAVQTTPGSGVTVTGWGVDPDTTHPVTVTIDRRQRGGRADGRRFDGRVASRPHVHRVLPARPGRAHHLRPRGEPRSRERPVGRVLPQRQRSTSARSVAWPRLASPDRTPISAGGWAIDPNTRARTRS